MPIEPRFITVAVERAERGLQLARERGDYYGHARAIDSLPDLKAAISSLEALAAEIEQLRDGLTSAEFAAAHDFLAGLLDPRAVFERAAVMSDSPAPGSNSPTSGATTNTSIEGAVYAAYAHVRGMFPHRARSAPAPAPEVAPDPAPTPAPARTHGAAPTPTPTPDSNI